MKLLKVPFPFWKKNKYEKYYPEFKQFIKDNFEVFLENQLNLVLDGEVEWGLTENSFQYYDRDKEKTIKFLNPYVLRVLIGDLIQFPSYEEKIDSSCIPIIQKIRQKRGLEIDDEILKELYMRLSLDEFNKICECLSESKRKKVNEFIVRA